MDILEKSWPDLMGDPAGTRSANSNRARTRSTAATSHYSVRIALARVGMTTSYRLLIRCLKIRAAITRTVAREREAAAICPPTVRMPL